MKYRSRIFCIGNSGDDSLAGHLETPIPMEDGQKHIIGGRKWVVTKVGKNMDGEVMVNLRKASNAKV